MFYVYILISQQDRELYIGFTSDLRSRYSAHTNGYVRSTKQRRPLELIYYEAYLEESDARKREKYLKGGNGREILKVQLQAIFDKKKYKFR